MAKEPARAWRDGNRTSLTLIARTEGNVKNICNTVIDTTCWCLEQAWDKPRMIKMIIFMGRMIKMIILLVRMIILMGQDDGIL